MTLGHSRAEVCLRLAKDDSVFQGSGILQWQAGTVPGIIREPGPGGRYLCCHPGLKLEITGPKEQSRCGLDLIQVLLFRTGELFGCEWVRNLPTCLREDSRSRSQMQKRNKAFDTVERGSETELRGPFVSIPGCQG